MVINLEYEAALCFRHIKNICPNSYLAEDNRQIIIGIDAVYFDSEKYSYEEEADFTGLFWVFSYEIINYYKKINKKENSEYYYPEFVFADAGAYIHFDKKSSVFSFFGDTKKYSDLLLCLKGNIPPRKSAHNKSFTILGNESEKKDIFLKNVNKAKEYMRSGDIF